MSDEDDDLEPLDELDQDERGQEMDGDGPVVRTTPAAVRKKRATRARNIPTPQPAPPPEAPSLPAEPWEKPPRAAWGSVARQRPDGTREPCRLYHPALGIYQDRFGGFTAEDILGIWGSGRYHFRWHAEGGAIVSTPRPVDLFRGDAPTKPADAKPEAAPEPAPPPPPPPQNGAHHYGPYAGAPTHAQPHPPPVPLYQPPPMPVEMPNDIRTHVMWQEYYQAKAREENEYRLRMERESHQRALAELETRHRLALDEAEHRAKRDRDHLTHLTKELLTASKAAQDLRGVEQRLNELEEDRGEDDQAGSALAQAVPMLIQTLGDAFRNRLPPSGAPPTP